MVCLLLAPFGGLIAAAIVLPTALTFLMVPGTKGIGLILLAFAF